MPDLSSSGKIFSLDAGAGFDEGIVRGDVGIGARLNYEGHFELCHGLDAALSAEAAAEADAHLAGLFLLVGYAHGEALAAAGLRVDSNVQFDLFDSFGFSAEAAAYAEAAVAGRLAAGLTFEDIASAARPLLSNVAYDVLIYFLNELDLVAGVWGKAAFAAMAKARIKLRGSLADDRDAGFVVEAGAEAGLGAGAGYDFYASLKLRNPKRFYLNSVERVSKELSKEAARLLPEEFAPAIQALELCLPIALNAAYEIGQSLPLNTLLPPEEAARPFIANFGAQLQRFTLDKLVDAGIAMLDDLVRQTVRDAVARLGVRQRSVLRAMLDDLIADLEGISPPEPLTMVGRFADILEALAPGQVAQWRGPMTIAWLAAAAVSSLRDSVGGAQASASAGLVGLGTRMVEVASVRLPQPPRLVLEELDAFFDPMPPHLEVGHAIAYLTGNAAQSLYFLIPGLPEAIDPLLSPLGLRGDELLCLALEGTFAADLSDTALYGKLRDFLKDAIDNEIDTRLLPALRNALPSNSDTRIWIDEAAQPSLRLLSGFLFERLDALVSGNIASGDVSPFLESFRSALSAVVSQIVIRNVVVVNDILREYVYDMLSDAFHALSVAIAASPQHPAAVAARELARSLVPPNLPLPSNYAPIAARLVADLFEAASVGFDPSVLSAARRTRLRALQTQVLLSIDGGLDYQSASEVETFFRQAAECLYIPAPQASIELIALLTEILVDQAARMLPVVDQALRRFFHDLTLAGVDDLDRMAREFLDSLLREVEEAWALIQGIDAALQQIGDEIRAATQRFQNQLAVAAGVLSSPSRRSNILDEVAEAGAQEARRLAREVPGYDLLLPDLKRAAQDTAEAAFRTAFSLARPALNEALKILGAIAGDMADVLKDALDLDAGLTALGAKIRKDVEDEVRRQLGIFGVVVPEEISPATVARAARDFIKSLPSLRSALSLAFQEKADVRAAEGRQRTKQIQRTTAQASHQAATRRRRTEMGGPISVDILSPLPLAPTLQANWAHRGAVPLRIRIAGGHLSFLEPPPRRRVLIVLNGVAFNPSPRDWTETDEGIRLKTTLTGGALRRGLNSIECSVTNGQNTILRKSALFVFQPLPALETTMSVNTRESRFGNALADEERLVLSNRGPAAVTLTGWSIFNERRDRFILPALRLSRSNSITIRSSKGRLLTPEVLRERGVTPTDGAASRSRGSGHRDPTTELTAGDGNQELIWSLQQVWRDRGDTVSLVDAEGVLRLTYSYGDRE